MNYPTPVRSVSLKVWRAGGAYHGTVIVEDNEGRQRWIRRDCTVRIDFDDLPDSPSHLDVLLAAVAHLQAPDAY